MTCELHRYHRPHPLRIENHHVIPRAWQRVWTPPGVTTGDDLWYDATMPLCPTSHSNVHIVLVRLMRDYERQQGTPAERIHGAFKTVVREYGRDRELSVALMSPELWLDKGGDLGHLIDMGQYGYGTIYQR